MLQGWVVVIVALGYIGLLFVVASYGDRMRKLGRDGRLRMLIYPLSLAIYCTSWTFFGSVGLASRTGFEFLTIYVGPVLMIGLCFPLIIRIVRLAKAHNITSIADFIAARYGKAQAVAATVALIAIIGTIPYIALQLKAVSSSLSTILAQVAPNTGLIQPVIGDIALFVALSMAAFAVLFGTRHIDATEHQDGLMLAIATESIVKLAAFLAVGIFVTFWMFDGPVALFTQAMERPDTAAVLTREPRLLTIVAMTALSLFAIVLLPRQFHVAVVENNSEAEVKRAAWLFPLYLVLINLFVVPIALAGMLTFPSGGMDSDMYVLALPLSTGSDLLTIAAFVGGLSAATAMVIVEFGRARHHGIERPRRATGAQTARGLDHQPARCRRAVAQGAADRDFRHPAPGLYVLPLGRRSAACLDRAPLLRRGGATCAGLLRRPDLAARHRARRDRGNEHRHRGVGLYAAAAELRRRRHCWPDDPQRGTLGAQFPAAAGAVLARPAAPGARRHLEPGAQSRRLYRLLACPGAGADRAAASRSVRPLRTWRRCRQVSGCGGHP